MTQIRRMDESKIRSGSPIRSKYPFKAERKKKKKEKKIPPILIRIYSPSFKYEFNLASTIEGWASSARVDRQHEVYLVNK